MATRNFRTPAALRNHEVATRLAHTDRAAPSDSRRWLDAMQCDQQTRKLLMQARYAVLTDLERRDFEAQLRTIIAEELTVDDTEYLRLTTARLHAWAALAREDAASLGRLGRAYDAIFATLPGAQEFRRVTAEQAVLMQLSEADQDRLCEAVPGMKRITPLTRFRLSSVPHRDAPRGINGSWFRRVLGTARA